MEFLTTEPVRTILLIIASIVIGFCLSSLLHRDKTSGPKEFSSRAMRKGAKKLAMFSDWYVDIVNIASTPEFKTLNTMLDATLTFVTVDGIERATQYHICAFDGEKDNPIPQDVFLEDLLFAVKLKIAYRIAVNDKDVFQDTITVPLNANEYERLVVKGYLLSAVHDAVTGNTPSSGRGKSKKLINDTIKGLEDNIIEITNFVDQHLGQVRSRLIGLKGKENENK